MDKTTKCLDDVARKMTKLNAIISKGAANLNLKDIMKATRKGHSIQSTVKKACKDFAGFSPSEQELKIIMRKMDGLVAEQQKQFEFTTANKPVFDKMHVSGLVKKNLQNTDGTSLDLTKILIEKCSGFPDLKAEAEVLDKRARESIDACIKLYSDAKGGEELADDKGEDSD